MSSFLCCLVISLVQTILAQNLKTYSGSFDDGKATYTYYLDEYGNKVLHGNFSYTYQETVQRATISVKINGSFDHGKRNSRWTFNSEGKGTFTKNVLGTYTKYTMNVTQSIKLGYKNGLLDGNYSYRAIQNDYIPDLGQYGHVKSDITCQFNFDEGNLKGKFMILDQDKDEPQDLRGDVQNGFFEGLISDNGKELFFNQGIMVKNQNWYKNEQDELREMVANFQPYLNSSEQERAQHNFVLKKYCDNYPSSLIDDYISKFYDNSDWLHDEIGGDDGYISSGCYYQIEYLLTQEELRLKEKEALELKIKQEREALDLKINEMMRSADNLYNQNKFHEAKNSYLQIQALDPGHKESQFKIQEIDEFLTLRSGAGYLYRNENSTGLNALKVELSKKILAYSQQFPEGQLAVKITVLFDTNGKNLSTYSKTESQDLNTQIEALLSTALSPLSKFGYFVNAHDQVQLNLNWSTATEKVSSNGEGIKGQGKLFSSQPQTIEQYILKQEYKYGDFTFEIKDKVLKVDENSTNLQDIYLVHYKLNAGPKYAFYSLVLPGWGSSKVSSGEHGYLTGLTYLLAVTGAAVTKIQENSEYNDYLNAGSQYQAEDAYQTVNETRKLFLLCIGTAAITYVYDFSWALVKGFGNVKKASVYKKALKKAPLPVQLSQI